MIVLYLIISTEVTTIWGSGSFVFSFEFINELVIELIIITDLCMCVGSVTYLTDGSAEVSVEDRLMMSLFFAGAITCMGLSAFFHTVLCHSKWACDTFSKCDYVGISVLILGSLVPWVYYSFYCDNISRGIYMTLILLLGSASIFVSLCPKFGTVQYRSLLNYNSL